MHGSEEVQIMQTGSGERRKVPRLLEHHQSRRLHQEQQMQGQGQERRFGEMPNP